MPPSRLGCYRENSSFSHGMSNEDNPSGTCNYRCLTSHSKSMSFKEARYAFICTKSIAYFYFLQNKEAGVTLWKECHSVCIFFTYYTLEKLFRTSLSLTPSPSDAASFEVKFSLASPECDSGKPRLQEAVSVTALWVCHCGYGRSYKLKQQLAARSRHLLFVSPISHQKDGA